MDPKSIAAMLVDDHENETIPGLTDEGENEADEGQLAAAEEMMAAIEAKDPHSFLEALRSFLAMA